MGTGWLFWLTLELYQSKNGFPSRLLLTPGFSTNFLPFLDRLSYSCRNFKCSLTHEAGLPHPPVLLPSSDSDTSLVTRVLAG